MDFENFGLKRSNGLVGGSRIHCYRVLLGFTGFYRVFLLGVASLFDFIFGFSRSPTKQNRNSKFSPTSAAHLHKRPLGRVLFFFISFSFVLFFCSFFFFFFVLFLFFFFVLFCCFPEHGKYVSYIFFLFSTPVSP